MVHLGFVPWLSCGGSQGRRQASIGRRVRATLKPAPKADSGRPDDWILGDQVGPTCSHLKSELRRVSTLSRPLCGPCLYRGSSVTWRSEQSQVQGIVQSGVKQNFLNQLFLLVFTGTLAVNGVSLNPWLKGGSSILSWFLPFPIQTFPNLHFPSNLSYLFY